MPGALSSNTFAVGRDWGPESDAGENEAYGLVTAVFDGVGRSRRYSVTFDGSREDPYIAWRHHRTRGDTMIGTHGRFESASNQITEQVQKEIDQER